MFDLEDDIFKKFEISYRRSVEIDLSQTASQNLKLFEDSIKGTLHKLEKKYNKMRQKASNTSERISELRLDFSEIESEKKYENVQNKIHKLQEKEHSYYIDSYWINLQLKSISEMQIINAFKNLEINIKELIQIAYPEINSKDLYKWENLLQFFKNKGILIAHIQGYKEMVDLKNLNNCIKHNGELNENVKKIMEFRLDDELNYVNLINFYERIKDQIETFLRLLVNEIKKELFQFDECRISDIAQNLKNRMEVADIECLIEKLRST